MNKNLIFLTICFFLTSSNLWAQSQIYSHFDSPIDLDKELKTFKGLNAFDGPIAKKSLKPLAQVKVFQAQRRFEDCQKSGLVLLPTSEVKEWLATAILQCSLASVENKKISKDLKKVVEAMEKLNFANGPWKSALADAWSLAHVRLYDDAPAPGSRGKILESWAKPWELLSKEQQSAWLETKADALMAAKKNTEAAFYFKQSQDLFPSKNFADKIINLLNIKTEVLPKPLMEIDGSKEQKLDDEIKKLQAANANAAQNVAAQVLMVESLKLFPQGKMAKKYKDRVLEIYFSSPKDKQDEALKNMLSAESSRLPDWAQSLHRRGDFKAALAVSEKALSTLDGSPAAGPMLWIQGRSAQFLNQSDKALEVFEKLATEHSATDEALEAQFRKGLILFRKEDFKKAAPVFEFVKNANKDRYQLNAWYWQIRSLQKEKSDQAETERDALVARYPFSYYGLRLLAEKQDGVISFPAVAGEKPAEEKTLEEKSLLPLLPNQQAIWHRFKILAENGWVLEAQTEVANLPQPVTASSLWKWLQLLSKAQQSPSVILLTNRLIEQNPAYRNPQYMSLSFPKSYATWIEPESKKYGIDPFLIRSLVRQESAFSLRAISTSSAMGLMQMIPPTADEIAKKLKMKVQIPEDMYRPEVNVPMGTFYVSDMLRQFSQNVPMALAAYNAGPVRLKAWLELRPEIAALREKHSSEPVDELWFDELPWTETSFYVKAILRNVLIYQLIDKGPVTMKPVFWSDLSGKSTPAPASVIVK